MKDGDKPSACGNEGVRVNTGVLTSPAHPQDYKHYLAIWKSHFREGKPISGKKKMYLCLSLL